ncbi:CARD8 isoform 8 [Pongo abelii]|uniref:CARD8 isoform 3 n=1 Tax=Pongo abelii TaxID=9601 RepID=A0A2J8U7E7_PONAB|nr:CARD8 isoform 3 [Pongo abelii]PNJ41189.1 CARD8 isoform 4 [Pongo abelii]PNJ41192.1 CARD8 isoform 8 [Pongo abelii]
MEKKECPEKSSSSEKELPRRVYRELPRVSEIRYDISHFFQEDDETEAEPFLFHAVPESQLCGWDIPRRHLLRRESNSFLLCF